MNDNIELFEDKRMRTAWDEEKKEKKEWIERLAQFQVLCKL